MISRCGNGFTASAAGVMSAPSTLLGKILPRLGLSFPPMRLIAAPALAACSLSVPRRCCTCEAAETAWLYFAATCPTADWAALICRMVRCSFSPIIGPTIGRLSSSEAAPVISRTAPFSGPSMPSRLVRPAWPAATSDDSVEPISSM
ncbi:hypothetical protein D3C76_1260640 [compost metagenome]